MTMHRLSGQTSEVVAFCAGLPAPARVAYEAAPTGFGLARGLTAAGIGCVVAAPGKIERPAPDRVKTDHRDAERLVRLLMILSVRSTRSCCGAARSKRRSQSSCPAPRLPRPSPGCGVRICYGIRSFGYRSS
jgi:transposase